MTEMTRQQCKAVDFRPTFVSQRTFVQVCGQEWATQVCHWPFSHIVIRSSSKVKSCHFLLFEIWFDQKGGVRREFHVFFSRLIQEWARRRRNCQRFLGCARWATRRRFSQKSWFSFSVLPFFSFSVATAERLTKLWQLVVLHLDLPQFWWFFFFWFCSAFVTNSYRSVHSIKIPWETEPGDFKYCKDFKAFWLCPCPREGSPETKSAELWRLQSL